MNKCYCEDLADVEQPSDQEVLDVMIHLATCRHRGQFDKGGMPYILHPLTVMHYVHTDDLLLKAIAVGHDVLEDGFDTVEEGLIELRRLRMPERVIAGILAVTKLPEEPEEVYKARVMNNLDAIRVKMADLRHNSDIRRLKYNPPREKDVQRMVKYQKCYLDLQVELMRLTGHLE